jgi:hypothetical protein
LLVACCLMLSKQYFSYIHAVNKLTYNKIELLTSIWIATEKKDIYTYVHSDNPILIVLYNYFLARALLHQLSRRNKIDLQ